MRRSLAAGWAVLPLAVWLAVPAAGQTSSPIVIPPAPMIVASPPGGGAPAASAPGTATPDTAALTAPPPGLVQTPAPQTPLTPGTSTVGASTPGAAANDDTGGAAGAAPAPADSWDPATTARLGVLNVVDGSVSEVQVPVGGQASIGDLKISVLACLRRPAGQVPDAAVFIAVQTEAAGAPPPVAAANAPLDAPPDGAADQPGAGSDDDGAQGAAAGNAPASYRGWMVRSMPAAMVVGDASETFRVIDCP